MTVLRSQSALGFKFLFGINTTEIFTYKRTDDEKKNWHTTDCWSLSSSILVAAFWRTRVFLYIFPFSTEIAFPNSKTALKLQFLFASGWWLTHSLCSFSTASRCGSARGIRQHPAGLHSSGSAGEFFWAKKRIRITDQGSWDCCVAKKQWLDLDSQASCRAKEQVIFIGGSTLPRNVATRSIGGMVW